MFICLVYFQDGYDPYRVMTYNSCDVIIICFCVTNQKSLENIKHKWMLELELHAPHTPFVLVGTKTDLRNAMTTKDNRMADHPWINEPINDKKEQYILAKEGQKTAKRLGAHCYMECSALHHEGVGEVFKQVHDVVATTDSHPGWKKHRRSWREQVKDVITSLFCGLKRIH